MNAIVHSALGSSAKDRTNEFVAAISLLQRQANGSKFVFNQQASPKDRHSQLTQQSRDFMTIASSIGKDIASTYVKLEKLTLLAKRENILFDDQGAEIQRLTLIIQNDTNKLNREIGQLRQFLKEQQEGFGSRKRSQHQASHSTSVVVGLQSRLSSMTSDFKNVLEVRTEKLKKSKSRQKLFSQTALIKDCPQLSVNGFNSGSILEGAANTNYEEEKANPRETIISMDGTQQSCQIQTLQDTSDAYFQRRADTMESIERTISGLASVFQQLSQMVKEQGEVIERIGDNVDKSSIDIERGHGELLKKYHSVISSRLFMVKILGVLMFFFVFFVIILA